MPMVPSLKFQLKVYGAVPPKARPVKVTGVPGVIAVGLTVKSAFRASGLMVMLENAEVNLALASVALTLIVNVPFTGYVWEAVLPATFAVPSPKFQLKKYGDVPPEAVAETETGVPTMPPAGTFGVTTKGQPEAVSVWMVLLMTALMSVIFIVIEYVPLTL